MNTSTPIEETDPPVNKPKRYIEIKKNHTLNLKSYKTSENDLKNKFYKIGYNLSFGVRFSTDRLWFLLD